MLIKENSISYLSSRALSPEAGLTHAFLTRHGGLAPMPFEGAPPSSDFSECFGFDHAECIRVRQVHGAGVVTVTDCDGNYHEMEGDAIITDRKGTAIGVLTADCLPIVLADVTKRAVGIVHAGWRGTIKGVALNAVTALTERFGTSPEELKAVFGPHIGPCCYTVGNEVVEAFKETLGEDTRAVDKVDGWRIDLKAANTELLLCAGLKNENITFDTPCTSCRTDLFFSYRKEGELAGRQLSFVRIGD